MILKDKNKDKIGEFYIDEDIQESSGVRQSLRTVVTVQRIY